MPGGVWVSSQAAAPERACCLQLAYFASKLATAGRSESPASTRIAAARTPAAIGRRAGGEHARSRRGDREPRQQRQLRPHRDEEAGEGVRAVHRPQRSEQVDGDGHGEQVLAAAGGQRAQRAGRDDGAAIAAKADTTSKVPPVPVL